VTRRPSVSGIVSASALSAVLLLVSCRREEHPLGRPGASIVLITIDTLRADYVNARRTPALATLARESIVFDHAVTVAPLTLPAHASLLTGAYPTRHGVHDNNVSSLPDSVPTFPLALQRRGYATAAFVSAVVLDHRYGLNRGFDVYDDEVAGPERSGAETVARAEKWIAAAPRPFFVWIHLFEPHAPYRTGSYESEVRAADTLIGGVFDFLRGKGLWNDLVVSVTSDHGESLGEHGEQTHGFFIYDATMRIPWIVKAPGLAAGTFAPLVRIVDQLPTIVELARAAAAPEPATVRERDGMSLVTFLARGTSPRLEAYGETFLPRDQFGWSQLRSLRTDASKFIEAPVPELYDVTADPAEAANVMAARKDEARSLQRTLAAIAHVSSAAPQPTAADPLLAEKLMSLGYIGSSPAVTDPGAALADPKQKIEVYNHIMMALELSEAGKVEAAIEELSAASRLDPDVAQARFLEGNLLGRLGRFPEAVAALERTLTLNPQFVAARFKLALALLRIGQPARARVALERVVQDQPGDFRAWHNLAAIAYSQRDLDAAERLERKALAINANYAEAWNTLGAIYIVRKQTTAAVEALTTATRLGPTNSEAFRNLSIALTAAGEPERARAAAAAACSIDPRHCASGDPR
jgi:choline-sulfatase